MKKLLTRLVFLVLKLIYHLLYHELAWTYDYAAALVSGGHWETWAKTSLEYWHGRNGLELGHGPGHLQIEAARRGYRLFGIDASGQMGSQAYRRILRFENSSGNLPRLARAYAQRLPFPDASFQTVISTFPSEYVFDPRTLAEVDRILSPDGRWVIIPTVYPSVESLSGRFFTWILALSGEKGGRKITIQHHFTDRFPGKITVQEKQSDSASVVIFIHTKEQ